HRQLPACRGRPPPGKAAPGAAEQPRGAGGPGTVSGRRVPARRGPGVARLGPFGAPRSFRGPAPAGRGGADGPPLPPGGALAAPGAGAKALGLGSPLLALPEPPAPGAPAARSPQGAGPLEARPQDPRSTDPPVAHRAGRQAERPGAGPGDGGAV